MPDIVQIDPIVRPKGIETETGYSKQRIFEMVKAGEFPPPIKLGNGPNGAIGWRRSTIHSWLAEREQASAA